MRRHALPAGAIARARRLRRESTDAEERLCYALRERLSEAKFRRQVPFGPYTADFASHQAKLIVEVDGGQHAEAVDHDRARSTFLNGEGYRVLRFWNNEVLTNLDGVLTVLERALSPCGRGLGEGPAASAAEKTLAPAAADAASSGLARSPLTPGPLPQGEREGLSNLSVWSL